MKTRCFGFIFFGALYGFIYKTYLYGKSNKTNELLFGAFFILWAFYGVFYQMEEKARNVKDDAGALVQIHYSEDVRVETQPVSSFNSTSITVSSAFSSVPNGEVIYAISGETDKELSTGPGHYGGGLQEGSSSHQVSAIRVYHHYSLPVRFKIYIDLKYNYCDQSYVPSGLMSSVRQTCCQVE